MKKILITVGALIVMVGGVFWFINSRSTAQKDSASTNQTLRVVTTNSILEDMVQNVGGERIVRRDFRINPQSSSLDAEDGPRMVI